MNNRTATYVVDSEYMFKVQRKRFTNDLMFCDCFRHSAAAHVLNGPNALFSNDQLMNNFIF